MIDKSYSMEELPDRLNEHLKTLRKADTQAQAIAWMTAAYALMEEAIFALKEKPEVATIERVVYVESAILPVVYHCPPPPKAKAWTMAIPCG